MCTDTVRASRKTEHLLRILGVGFGIAVGVGNTIGTGILRTPGEVASYLGSASLVFAVWILGGVYALLCSSSVTELGTMLPRAGGVVRIFAPGVRRKNRIRRRLLRLDGAIRR